MTRINGKTKTNRRWTQIYADKMRLLRSDQENLARVGRRIAAVSGDRVVPVAVTGNLESDIERVKAAANGGAHLAFDMVGGATDQNATLTALRSLRRGGRLVLMGSMSAPLSISYLDVMLNNWEILGQFM